MIGIINYRMGNLRSVQKAFEYVGASAVVLDSPAQLTNTDQLILPGVGAFADGMTQLEQGGWVEAIREFIDKGKPFLGICLGMQLLFDSSQECEHLCGQTRVGLSQLQGKVIQFEPRSVGDRKLKVPHMGWNSIHWDREDPLYDGLSQGDAVYFVHSYYAVPESSGSSKVVSATSEYGGAFCASVWHENIWATQFHPEKSQTVGLKILRNFTAI